MNATRSKQYTEVYITPEIARDIVEKSQAIGFRNRPVSKSRVLFYADIMEKGKWYPGIGTIEISPRGALVDGQHRIQAVIKSNVTVPFYVTYDASEEQIYYTDKGFRRLPANSLSILGVPNPFYVAAAGRVIIYLFKKGITTPGGSAQKFIPSDLQLYSLYKKFPDAFDTGSKFYSRQQIKRLASASCVAFYVIFASINEKKADEFYTQLCDGIGLEKNDPVYVLRGMLERVYKQDHGARSFMTTNAIIMAWNLFMRNEKRVRFAVPGETPRILGFDKDAFFEGIENVLD